jgi:hypothetical protein
MGRTLMQMSGAAYGYSPVSLLAYGCFVSSVTLISILYAYLHLLVGLKIIDEFVNC